MAVSSVLAPNGKTYTFEHPDGASQEDLFKFVHQSSQVKPKARPAKPGVVENVARGIAAGAAQSSYDTLNEVGQELTKITSIREKAKLAFDKWAGNPGDTTIEDIDKRQRAREASIQKYIGDTGDLSGKAFGVDEGRLSADVGRGLGQLPLMVLTKGASAVPMAMNEVRKDAEETFGTKYADMSDEQRDKVRVAQGVYSAFSLVANKVGLKGMGLGKLDDFLKGGKTIKGSVVKQVLKDQAKGGGTEFATEFSEAAAMDQIARVYDPDREYSLKDVIDYGYEGFVGGIVGTTVATGTSVVKNIGSSTSETKKSDLNKEVEDRPAVEIPRTVQVEYKELDGQVRVVPISITEGQDPMAVAEEALAGRYDPAYGVTVTDQSQPVGPEQELDLPDQAPDPTQEQVPVQPEAAVEPKVVEAEAPVVPDSGQAPVLNTVQVDLQGLQPEQLQNVVQQLRQKLVNAREAESQGKPVLGGSASIEADLNNVKSYIASSEVPAVDQAPVEPVLPEVVPQVVPATEAGTILESELLEKNPDATEGILNTIKEIISNESSVNYGIDGDGIITAGGLDFRQKIEIQLTKDEKIALNKLQAAKSADDATIEGNIKIAEEFNVIMRKALDRAITKEPTQAAPATEQAPATRSFSLPQNLRKGKPGYAKTQNVKFASDLERAAYSATTTPRDDTAKRKRNKYRKILQDAGYSSAEINSMGREVRAQMKDQYKGKDSPISVSLKPDVVAEAASSVTPPVSSVSNTQDPSRVGTARNPDGETSQDSNIDVSMVPEETLEKHMEIMDYGHLPADIKNEKDTKVKYEKLVNFMKDNLLSLYKAFPDELRARATQWYDGANKIANGFAKRYQITTEQASAVLAVLSPQKDWFMNVAQGEQVIHIWRNYQDVKIEGIEYDGMIEEIIDSAVAPVKQKKKKLVNETAEQTKRRQNYNKKLDKKAKDDRRFVLEQIKGKTVRELAQDPSKEGQALMAWAIRTNAQVQFGRNYSIVTPEGDFGGPSLRLDGQPANNGWGSTSEIVKAVSIIEDGSAQNISDRLGSEHKVRNFYNNIAAPNSPYGDATMDTHAVAAALLMPLGSSAQQVSDNFGSGKAGKTTKGGQTVSGTYYVYLDAYRRAAKEVGLQPRQMQSITWEAIRQVYLPQDRKPELVKQRTKEWNTYKDETEARQQIIGETINAPEWSGTSPSGRSGTSAAGVQGNGDGSILGGDLLFRGGSDIIGVPGNSTQITVPAGNRLRLYRGTVSYRSGSSKNTGRSEKTFAGISRVNAKDFVEIASRNKRNHKFGSSVDVYKEKDYKGYHLIVAKGKGKAYVTLAISPSGEVSSVTASKSATKADVAAAFDLAIASGAVRWLNGFDTVLGDIYSYFGFKPVARLPFDPEQSPSDWSYKKYQAFKDGQPDLLFMKFDGQMGNKLSDYPNPGYASSYDQALELATEGNDVTAKAADTAVEDRGPRDTYDNGGQVQDAIEKEFNPIGDKISTSIVMRMGNTDYVARYNATRGIIEYNPMLLLKRSKAGIRAAMREEIIHAAMHQVLMVSARKKFSMAEGGKVWTDFFGEFGKSLTDAERADIKDVYQNIKPEDYVGYGSEYSRAVIQNLLYGEFSEEYQMQSQGGPAWNTVVKLLRSVQAYMAKVLGPMIKTNPEAAQVIVDSVELLKAIDPSIRPKSQDVVAQAYDATDKNTAKENTEAGERVSQSASERVRDERKWFESEIFQRDKISKALTPVVTRLRRINVKFARLFSKLEEKIRFRNLKYRKQSVNFFNKLNAIKGNEFLELKQLIFFSPTPQEADSFTSKNRIQRRDALLHKHGLLNMYRLDVQPILEELYIEYNKSGMPDMGYLEDYFPHVINDLNGLIKSYGHKTKRTFEVLVRDENLRRSKITDKNGDPAGLPEMDSEERARFFQDFLQNKLRKDLNGVNIPANAKGRSIVLIPEDKLKFYDDPGQAFGKYTSSMVTALENYKVIGSTNKSGELGALGQLTEDLFNEGLIDQADVDQLKSLTELATVQFSKENPILRFAGVFTYASTLIDVGTVAVQVLDLYKVLMQRGPAATLKGVYRTVTGNREYDLERDFGFSEKQIMAEFDDQGFGDKALEFGLRYIVPFQQMDAAMKHSSIEAALIDFLRKAKSDVGSKKYNQLVDELTITLGREDAMKAVTAFRLDRYKDSPEAKAALLEELLQRQPMTYLQVPETYRRNPGSRLFYKLKTFMLLDINFNREMALNDLLGPEKTLKQRTKALKILTSMALALAAIGMPKDMLMDWIRGKDTYLPDHVANALLGIFGLNKYSLKTVFESGPIDAVADRFTPAAYNIFDNIEDDLMSWVNGNKEISEFQMWANAPLFDVWGRFTKKFEDQQKRIRGEKRKQGQRPTIQRF